MRGHAILLVALAVLMLPVTARAADVRTLECVGEHLDAAAVAMIEDYNEAMVNAPIPGPLPEPGDAMTQAIARAGEACAKQNGWSREAMLAASGYALGKAGRPGSERALRKLGIDPTPFATFYYGLPAETRAIPMTRAEWRGPMTELAKQAQAGHWFDPAQARRVGRYIGSLNVIDLSRAAFLRS